MATPNRYVGRHAASGGLGPVHACPSIPAWPHDRSLVPGNYSPDVSGGRHSFPSPVLWQLAGLTYDVSSLGRVRIKCFFDSCHDARETTEGTS